MKKSWIILSVIIIAVANNACNHSNTSPQSMPDLTHLNFTTEEDTTWSNLFIRNHGWLGGDGIFEVTMDGDETMGHAEKSPTLIWFSDSQIGDVENNKLKGKADSIIHNAAAVLSGGQPNGNTINFYWDTTGGHSDAIFKPSSPASQPNEYYWLGDAFVNQSLNNDIFLFGYRIKSTLDNPGFSFKVTGNTMIHIPAGNPPQFANQKQMDIPFYLGRDPDSVGTFGNGILVNTKEAGEANGDGYVYIYGVRHGEVIVARVLPQDIEQFAKWTFWNGKDWATDAYAAATVATHASNELSVTRLEDGRYLMVFTSDGVGDKISARLGASPYGPFGQIINLYTIPASVYETPNYFTYNAKAHPVLSKPGELLVTYNINSRNYFNDIVTHPNFYRPRFVKLKYQLDK
ncbi:DUF4185 domain-containing protein [Ferruginibacter albus]|uniref:DUF4185 domain-containing protein n=1 Tax=Ferruginibacter albus TaxID=2875540 RepID=UPI001CC692D9|nr:DUF4185 domain-containing protein [Ferruginibacter albus]UAY51931.1 DUF4185 domain-containing protein [Ferruginibacter albus]